MSETIESVANIQIEADGTGNNTKPGHESDKVIPDTFVDLSPNGEKDRVYKWVKKEGAADDKPIQNDTVFVHYVGRLWGGPRDGEKFDSSRDRGEPFSFELGKGRVIKGWDTAVATMNRGEIAEILCRPSYAYGNKGTGNIPPNSTLCFEVELLDFHGEDLSEAKDKSIMKRTLKQGESWETPTEFSKVTVSVSGRVLGAAEPFDLRNSFEFSLGEGSACEPLPIPSGLEAAIGKMKKHEHARVTLKPQQAFGASGLKVNGAALVGANATVEYDVELCDFIKAKETWELSSEEKIVQARQFKERANSAFTKGQYGVAASCYKQVVKLLEFEGTVADNILSEKRSLLLAVHANLAQTYLNVHNDQEALVQAGKALEIDAQHAKALFRKGVAQQRLLDFEAAKDTFACLVAVEPNNQSAKRELAACQNRIKQQLNAEKKWCRSLFEKMANREEDELDKIEREMEEKAKAEREAAAKNTPHPQGQCGSCEGSDADGEGDA